jgi:hypothetical protein
MTSALACSMALAAQLAVGGLGLFDCLKKDHRDDHHFDGPECCRSCLSEFREVQELLVEMQRHPNWRRRDDAAHELREFDWRSHPDLAPALAYTMLNDGHEEVREEAAETLAKLAPCDGSAHLALRQVALTDPDHATRKWAKRALDRLDHRCLTDCSLCGPVPDIGPGVMASPIPTGSESGYEVELESLPPIRAPRIYGEVPFDRVAPQSERSAPIPDSVDPSAPALRPGLLPPALSPLDSPVEVLPPAEPPPPSPPAVSPFGASRHPIEPGPRPPARVGGPVRLFTVGRSG